MLPSSTKIVNYYCRQCQRIYHRKLISLTSQTTSTEQSILRFSTWRCCNLAQICKNYFSLVQVFHSCAKEILVAHLIETIRLIVVIAWARHYHDVKIASLHHDNDGFIRSPLVFAYSILWVPFPGDKAPGTWNCEIDRSRLFSVDFKNAWNNTAFLHICPCRSADKLCSSYYKMTLFWRNRSYD